MRDPENGDVIDEALALWFPAPHSETGEDMAELQIHGGHAVIAAVLDALGRIEGCRPAEAGEFTRRAFENGRLDLTAVEGLADLIAAETPAQRRQAFRQLKGLIGDRAEAWRRTLIEALALVEARIDFADEGDVPEDLVGPALASVTRLRDEIAAALADGRRGERLRDGIVIAIAGPPNAGKSTLLNRLARREAAIVSPYSGDDARRDRGPHGPRRLPGDAPRHRRHCGRATIRSSARACVVPRRGRRAPIWCCGSLTYRPMAELLGMNPDTPLAQMLGSWRTRRIWLGTSGAKAVNRDPPRIGRRPSRSRR